MIIAIRQILFTIGDHPKQPWIHGSGGLISQTEDDDTWRLAVRRRENVSKIKIEREHDPALAHCFGCDF